MKRSDMVTIPYDYYLQLVRDSLRGIAIHNCLNKMGKPHETLAAAEEELVKLWQVHEPNIKDFDELVKYHATTTLSVLAEKQIELDRLNKT